MADDWSFGDALGSTAKGAAAGAVIGPAGAVVGGLVGLATSVAPEIGRWLGGKGGEQTAAAVVETVAAVTGSAEPASAAAALANDPEAAWELRGKLAAIAAEREAAADRARLDELKATLADTSDARRKEIELARDRSPLAYGSAVVTLILLALFCYCIVFAVTMAEGTWEALKTLTTAAVFYWVGSSRGSAAKDSPRVSADGR